MPAAPDFPPAPDAVKPVRALISLSDKTGLEDAITQAAHQQPLFYGLFADEHTGEPRCRP